MLRLDHSIAWDLGYKVTKFTYHLEINFIGTFSLFIIFSNCKSPKEEVLDKYTFSCQVIQLDC